MWDPPPQASRGAEARGCSGPAEEGSPSRGGSQQPCPALGRPKLWPAPSEGQTPLRCLCFGKPFEFFSGRARAPALTAAAASGKGVGFHNVSFLPQPGCPDGCAISLKNPKIGYFKAGSSPEMQRITSLSDYPGERRTAPAINTAEPGGGRLQAFPFSLTTPPPQKMPDLSPPGPQGPAVAKIGSHAPALLSESVGHLYDFHFIF